MKKVIKAAVFMLVMIAYMLPISVFAEDKISIEGTGITSLTVPEGYVKTDSRPGFVPYSVQDTVLFYSRSKVYITVEKHHAGELADFSQTTDSELSGISLTRVDEIRNTGYEVYLTDEYVFGGAEYLVFEYSAPKRYFIEYMTVAGANRYVFRMVSNTPLVMYDRMEMSMMIESIVWDSSVTGIKFNGEYVNDEAGISFGVPQDWQMALKPYGADFTCSGGESVRFEYGELKSMFPYAESDIDTWDVANYLGCEENYVLKTETNGKEFINALILSDETQNTDYHVFTAKNGIAYHFIYSADEADAHQAEFSALINSLRIYRPDKKEVSSEPAAVKAAPEEPRKKMSVSGIMALSAGGVIIVSAVILIFIKKRSK